MEVKYDGFEIEGIRQVVEGKGMFTNTTLSFGKGFMPTLTVFL